MFCIVGLSGMDWLCPSYSEVLARQIKQYHGQLTTELVASHVVPIVQTGNLQVINTLSLYFEHSLRSQSQGRGALNTSDIDNLGPYVLRANSPLNRVYFLNGDNGEKWHIWCAKRTTRPGLNAF